MYAEHRYYDFTKIKDTSKIMVGFNPYVSVLDMYNYSRYGITELVPLFAKLATRFKKVHIQLGINRFGNKAEIGKFKLTFD